MHDLVHTSAPPTPKSQWSPSRSVHGSVRSKALMSLHSRSMHRLYGGLQDMWLKTSEVIHLWLQGHSGGVSHLLSPSSFACTTSNVYRVHCQLLNCRLSPLSGAFVSAFTGLPKLRDSKLIFYLLENGCELYDKSAVAHSETLPGFGYTGEKKSIHE